MTDPLATYLHDHLAGSKFAIELLKSLRDHHAGEPLGDFAVALLVEIQEDREVLERITDRVGKEGLDLKEATAWLTQKVSQWKLRRDNAGEFGAFEALETLALGILGKAALWRALSVISQADTRVRDPDFEQLFARAQAQHAKVEEYRLQMARSAFHPAA